MAHQENMVVYFSKVADRYDLVNHLLSFNCDRRWRRRLVDRADLKPGDRIMDLCTGTCDILVDAHAVQPGSTLAGLDVTPAMLHIGQRKLKRAGASAQLMTGDAQAVPVPDASFEVVTIGFGLRNLEDPQQGLEEMRRLLAPGGRALILEFAPAQPGWFGAAYGYYLRHVIPRLGGWITGSRPAYTYLSHSIQEFFAPERMVRTMKGIGFKDVQAEALTGRIAYIYVGTR